ncbi:hypothetical protein RJ639_003639 [Escallonia herrerae]|uniref:NB-ARC domain-containing protein n=1 Tax=Escallonia herrerae TaxID=1293975 RepID=A0AA88W2H9_9ASTE|nr:hypothetical protein RJ639_003639 [Escallonia herrerae]
MGICTSKPFSPESDFPDHDAIPTKDNSNPVKDSVNPAKDNDKPAQVEVGKKSPLFSFYSPSPAHYLFGKKSPARTPTNARSNSTPKQFFRVPPSLGKHIKEVLARRHGSVKQNEAVIPEGDEEDDRTGLVLNPALVEWLEQVEQLDTEVGSFIVASTTNNNGETLSKYCPSCCFSCKPGLEVTRKLKDVKQLIDQGSLLRQTADAELKLGKQEVPKGQSIPGPSVPSKCLYSVLNLLNPEDVNRIGVWGMGGVGKTTLVRTLNNTPSFMQPFSMVIWVTVSKQFDNRRVQIDIAERLKLDTTMEESMESTAHRIFQRLQLEEKLLLILDDVWEAVDLDHLGMKTDEDIKVEVLDDEESWKLFTQNAGKVVNLENIEQVAKQVARECGGLPLLIKIVGASMRGKEMVQLWEDGLSEMRRSPVPNINGIHDKSWLAEGLIDELRNYEESMNRGIALIENLKDSCLLERGNFDASVKMHDVVRDLASWIPSSSSSEDGCKAFVRSGLGLINFPEVETTDSVKRVSFMRNRTKDLPEFVVQCPELRELRALLLWDCHALEELPPLGGFTKLQVLDCYEARRIKELPQELEKFPESLGRNVRYSALRFLVIAD